MTERTNYGILSKGKHDHGEYLFLRFAVDTFVRTKYLTQ
jgi:hypothetical protein